MRTTILASLLISAQLAVFGQGAAAQAAPIGPKFEVASNSLLPTSTSCSAFVLCRAAESTP
jgi:hypothetical protein